MCELTEQNAMLLGILIGVLLMAPTVVSLVAEAVKRKPPNDDTP
jgi:hypothetical protein